MLLALEGSESGVIVPSNGFGASLPFRLVLVLLLVLGFSQRFEDENDDEDEEESLVR